jgi:putative DNA methylase
MTLQNKIYKKLIEVGLPLPEINDASAYDKMPGIGPHPKGIHHWWARLPLPTARAILFASVVDDPEAHPEKWPTEEAQNSERERLFDIIRSMMGKKLHEHPEIYADAYGEMLRHTDGKLPAVFDPFAGGGSIPLEASRLGFEAHAGDLNPVAVLLNKCNLELAPFWVGAAPVNPENRRQIAGNEAWRGTHGLATDLRYYARLIHQRATEKIGKLYPQATLPRASGGTAANVIAWIWVRTVASPNPAAKGRHVPIASSFVLSTKSGKLAWAKPRLDDGARDGWRFEIHGGSKKDELARARLGSKAGKAQDFICLLTNTPIRRAYVQAEGKANRLGLRLMSVVADSPTGRLYLTPDKTHEQIEISAQRASIVADARTSLLSGSLPTRAEITGGVCTAYGLSTWGHLFTDRQVTALLTISDQIIEIGKQVKSDATRAGLSEDRAAAYERTISTFLALAADRCADFNNSLCRWSPSNEKVMNLFGKQAIPMVFDFAEANFLGKSVGSWSTCSEYVADCVEVIAAGNVHSGDASQLDAATEKNGTNAILVSTDPPYYNNISYAVLSDFFYVWLRRSIGKYYPEIFGTVLVPKMPELIAAANRFDGDALKAKQHFEDGFREAFISLRDRMDPRFPLTVYYAFKQEDEDGEKENIEGTTTSEAVDLTTGWETLLEALISSGFQITATWPVRASQKWRMVSMGANALASYIVLACRPRAANAPNISSAQFRQELKAVLPAALRHLQQGNIAPVDFAQAALGPGMAIYSRYNRILEPAGKQMSVRSAINIINQTLTEVLSEVEDEFDSETRWAIAWFEQHGFDNGEFGDAEILSKAKVTSVSGLQQAAIVLSKGGKVRLRKPEELPADWDVKGDRRPTVWEMTHHLLRRYHHLAAGDHATSALLRKFGAEGEMARDLAYRLFKLSERKKLAQEALGYNALVLGWLEIARLARDTASFSGAGEPVQPDMFGRT